MTVDMAKEYREGTVSEEWFKRIGTNYSVLKDSLRT